MTNVKDGNGEVVRYCEEGNELSRLTYRDGKPIDKLIAGQGGAWIGVMKAIIFALFAFVATIRAASPSAHSLISDPMR